MRRVGNDRSRFPSNPPENTRKIERLRDEDSVLETNAVGGGTFDVTGLVPEFAGVPAGLQQFYVAAVVTDDTINMNETILLEDGLGNLPFTQDVDNNFGVGTASIVGKLDAASGAAVFNYASGSASSLVHGLVSNQGGYRVGPSFAVSVPFIATSTPTVAVVTGGVVSVITLSAPATHTWLQGVGLNSAGNAICAVWTSNNSTGSGTVLIAEHSPTTGARTLTGTSVSIPRTGAISCLIDNGLIAFVLPTTVYSANASASDTLTLAASTGVSDRSYVTNNISSDGYIYMFVTFTLVRLNVTTGLLSTWPEVRRRFDGDPPVLVATTTPFSMHAISSTKLIYGSAIYVDADATYYPLYSSIVLDGLGANVSDSVFTAYSSPAATAVNVYALTRLSNGDVVFALKANVTPDYRYLVKVTGP